MEHKKNEKTKKVAGVDLGSDCFLYTPDLENTASWIFPVLVRGDEAKTRNLIVMHLHRFDVMTDEMPCELRQELFDMLRGCAISHRIRADRRTFAAKSDAPTPAAEPPTPPPTVRVKTQAAELTDPAVMRAVAMADKRATAMLRALGLE